MSAEHPPTPDGPGPVDWDRYEHELNTGSRDGGPAGTPPAGPDAAGTARVLVDSPEAQRPDRPGLAGLRAAQRRPILPAWLRSRAELAEVSRWVAGYAAHSTGYHLARAPV
jgi:DNA segregation ATPase FtsK/SpoIIIE, S-DNA-T family